MTNQIKDILRCLTEYSASESKGWAYTFTLKPGLVHHLAIKDFLKLNVEELIDFLRNLSPNPQIKVGTLCWPDYSPLRLELKHADALIPNAPWDERLRFHHKFGLLYEHHAVPSTVYHCFHTKLRLKELKFDELLESWVKAAWQKQDLTQSYEESSEHVVWECCEKDMFRLARGVFLKTPFILGRLALIAAEDEREAVRQAEEVERVAARLREDEEARRLAEDLDRLQKSSYRTFVYLMEDLRNGCFKIGHSKTPGKRERTLQSEVPTITLRFSIPADEEHEKQLHWQFDHKNQRGEWFSLTPDELMWIISFLKKNGDLARASVDYEWLGKIAFQSSAKHEVKT